MKRRRNLLVVLLLVCAIGLGVGYAAITGTLTINGNTTIEQQPFDVKFIGFAAGNNPTNNKTANATDNNALAITCSETTLSEQNPEAVVNLSVKNLRDLGDSVTATLTIKNFNETSMKISLPTILYSVNGQQGAQTNEYYDVTFAFANRANEVVLGAVNSGSETTEVTVTVTLKKIYIGGESGADATDDDYVDNFKITLPVASEYETTANANP